MLMSIALLAGVGYNLLRWNPVGTRSFFGKPIFTDIKAQALRRIAVRELPLILIALIALVFLVVSVGMLTIVGCEKEDDPHPYILTGTWKEDGQSRGIVLYENGVFQHVGFANGRPGDVTGDVKGTGTWEATDIDLTIRLSSGHFGWLDKTVTASPSITTIITCQYDISEDGIDMTLSIADEVVLYWSYIGKSWGISPS